MKQSNQIDDNGYEDEAARLAAQMVADAHLKFSSKLSGKGKKGNGDEAEAEPFSLLHKVPQLACTVICQSIMQIPFLGVVSADNI